MPGFGKAHDALGHIDAVADQIRLIVDVLQKFYRAEVDSHADLEVECRFVLIILEGIPEAHGHKKGILRIAKEANGRSVARVQDDPVADGDVLDGLGKEGIEVFLDPNLLIDRFSRIFNNVNKNNTANERSIWP